MKITPDTNVHDLLAAGIELGAFHTLREVVVQIRQSGDVRGVGVFQHEVESILCLSEMTPEEKKEIVAGFLPPWFAEIVVLMKKVQADLGLDQKEEES